MSATKCLAAMMLASLAIVTVAAGAETRFDAFLTAYTWFDNTPPGSVTISHPAVHEIAGGTGSYADPITLAVGHSLATGSDVLDFPPGTRFYVPALQRYFVVEDTCGDGPEPEAGPCHTNTEMPGIPWLDMWIGGAAGTSRQTTECAEQVTGRYEVIRDPGMDYAVSAGEIYETFC